MKKQLIIYFSITAVLLLCFTGCGRAAEEKESSSEESPIQSQALIEEAEDTAEAEHVADSDDATDSDDVANSDDGGTEQSESASTAFLSSTSDIRLVDTDGKGSNYIFTYAGEEFSAIYSEDNWKIVDSYKINEEADMMIICQALIDEHPVHGRDMVSYRVPDDMVYEWTLHNMAYAFVSDDETMRNKAKDVDFDPEDQGRTFEEIYKSRTGKEFDFSDILEK